MKNVTEAQTQRAVIEYLAAKRYFYLRMNSGSLPNAQGRPVRFGTPGCADIMAILPSKLPMWLEIKSPTGKQSPEQKAFQEEVEAHGHMYMVVRNISELIEWIDGIY